MDSIRIGNALRVLRTRKGWRQEHLGRLADVSQSTVSLVERGQLDHVALDKARRVARALDAQLVLLLRWRGGELDRLLDEGHATLSGDFARLLDARGWEVRPEVTFSVFGERGSIDLLAWRANARALLVVEIKTQLASVEETLRRLDVKARLAGRVAGERFGWQPTRVDRILVLRNTSTARRRVVRHDAVLRRACPDRGRDVLAWLRHPDHALAGLVFLTATSSDRRGPHRRVRGPTTAARC